MLAGQKASGPDPSGTGEPREGAMLTRGTAMIGAIAAGAAMRTRRASAKASQPATAVDFDVPDNACDCHTHIHADPEKFPFFSGRIYTPELASPEEMSQLRSEERRVGKEVQY